MLCLGHRSVCPPSDGSCSRGASLAGGVSCWLVLSQNTILGGFERIPQAYPMQTTFGPGCHSSSQSGLDGPYLAGFGETLRTFLNLYERCAFCLQAYGLCVYLFIRRNCPVTFLYTLKTLETIQVRFHP